MNRMLLSFAMGALILGYESGREDLFAHHSFAMYDSTKTVVIDGTVKEFQWTNPHAILWILDGPHDDKRDPELWTVELPTSPGNLTRMGWTKHSLNPGERVAVEISPLRDGKHGGSFKKVTLADSGKVLTANLRDFDDSAP
jgi:hypothetical protein